LVLGSKTHNNNNNLLINVPINIQGITYLKLLMQQQKTKKQNNKQKYIQLKGSVQECPKGCFGSLFSILLESAGISACGLFLDHSLFEIP